VSAPPACGPGLGASGTGLHPLTSAAAP